jgi:YbbR domain-containing protein
VKALRLLLDHAGLKIVSLVLAVLLWSVIAGEKTLEVGFVVPLELQNVPPNVEIVSGVPDAIEVRVRAAAAIIQQIDNEDLAVQLDISDVSPGERIFHLSDAVVRRPFGVTVVRLSPAILTLTLEDTEHKTMPIDVRTAGELAEGYEIAEVSCDPAAVVVAGPRSRLAMLTRVYTETVNIAGAHENVVKKVSVGTDEPLARIDGDPHAMITIRVREKEGTRIFENIPIEVRGGSARIRPDRVRVTITGPLSKIADVELDALRAFVEAQEIRSPEKVRVAIENAGDISSISVQAIEPESVLLVPIRR